MADDKARISVDAHAGAVVLRVSVCIDGGFALRQIQAPMTPAEARAVVVSIQRAIEEAECPPTVPRAASSVNKR